MRGEPGLADAAQLFKVLGSESRLWLLQLIGEEPRTVGALADATGMTQPLVSQHLRTLRQSGLVSATRSGKEVTYRVDDLHVSHVIADALAHVNEPARIPGPGSPTEGTGTMSTETQAEHTVAEHEHGADCGHEAVQHDGHIDYVHDGHKHAAHEDHYDEH